MRLQTIVSREMDPHDTNVVSVTSIHAGNSDNVISDEAKLSLDIRNVSQSSRERVIEKIKRIVRFESQAGAAVKEPTFVFTREYPVTANDAEATERISRSFSAHFGEGKHTFDSECSPCGASEDFSNLATAVDKPYCKYSNSPALCCKN
jgi:metal-dependent amidase/aminoacylase/carboxypeptidase family protein